MGGVEIGGTNIDLSASSMTGAELGSILGKIWNIPNTAIGMAWGLAGVPFGTNIEVGNNAIQFINHPFTISAITLGNAIIYGEHFPPEIVGEHELQHTLQGELLGPLYLPANVLGGIMALLGEEGHWHGPENFMEAGPQSDPPVPFPCD